MTSYLPYGSRRTEPQGACDVFYTVMQVPGGSSRTEPEKVRLDPQGYIWLSKGSSLQLDQVSVGLTTKPWIPRELM